MITAAALIDFFKEALKDKWGYIWGQSGDLWTQKKQQAKIQYMVNKYGTNWKKNSEAKQDVYYQSALNGAKWIGHNVSDCSGMFVAAYRKLKGGSISHGSNSIWKSACSSKGRLVDGKKENKQALQSGTAVFTGQTESDHPHIGLYIGSGKVIEAASTDSGIVTSNVTAGKWKWWGELKAVEYADAPDPGEQLPTIRKGEIGPYVKKAQTLLVQLGYDIGPCGIDGEFGSATQKAVKQFQKDWGIAQDGVIGPETWKLLTSAPVKGERYSVIVSHLTESQAKALAGMYQYAAIEKEVG